MVKQYVTTITIIHDAESMNTAGGDSFTICKKVDEALEAAHAAGEIGKVHNVTVYTVREKM